MNFTHDYYVFFSCILYKIDSFLSQFALKEYPFDLLFMFIFIVSARE